MKTLYDLALGAHALVKDVRLNDGISARLKSLGVEKGAEITLLKISLFRRTFLLSTGETWVGLRKNIARNIIVADLETPSASEGGK